MTEQQEETPYAGKSYRTGNIGAHARVAIGEHINWIEQVFGSSPEKAELAERFSALIQQIEQRTDMDDDTRSLSIDKTKAIAEGLTSTNESSGSLRRTLLDAKGWFSSTAGWVWDELRKILSSETAQKTIATIADASTKTAIKALIGTP